MIQAEDILSELEAAVDERRDCPALTSLDAVALRSLLYDVVRSYRGDPERPAEQFRRWIDGAAQAHASMQGERSASIFLRRRVLEEIRVALVPALPALLGPIYIEVLHVPSRQHQRTAHPLVRGVKLLDGEKWAPVGNGTQQLTGRSWWLVAIPQIDDADIVAARYAYTEHNGTVVDGEGGRTRCEVTLCSVDEVASQVRDDRFATMLNDIQARLATATSSNARVAKALKSSSAILQRCVAAATER